MRLQLDDQLAAWVSSDRLRARGFESANAYVSHLIRRDREMDRLRRFLSGSDDGERAPGFPTDCLERLAESVRRW